MSARLVPEACIKLPLLGAGLNAAQIGSEIGIADALRSALAALLAAA